MRLEFPLSPLLFFFLKSNIQTVASFSKEMKSVVYPETDILKGMSSFLRLQKVSYLRVNVCNITFQEAVPWGNMIGSELKKKLFSI